MIGFLQEKIFFTAKGSLFVERGGGCRYLSIVRKERKRLFNKKEEERNAADHKTVKKGPSPKLSFPPTDAATDLFF